MNTARQLIHTAMMRTGVAVLDHPEWEARAGRIEEAFANRDLTELEKACREYERLSLGDPA